MNIRCVAADELTQGELKTWSEIQHRDPMLSSPYFRPEFTQAVAAVRSDVEVAVLEENCRAVGFLPFQRSRRKVGRPVGAPLSDFHGVIKRADVDLRPREILNACDLVAWHFDHLVPTDDLFARYVRKVDESPYIDLTGGFEHYIETRDNGRRIRSEYGQKKRKLARELGPIRYEFHQPSPDVVGTFMQWKSEQFERTRSLNIFRFRWVRMLLEKLLEFKGRSFAPVVSTVYAGDTLAGINFGMRSFSVLHPWFPTYNVELANHSPGNLHWIETMKAAPGKGIVRIDLGRGPESYKRRLMSGAITVAEGTVDASPATAAVRRASWRMRERVRESSLGSLVRVPADAAYKFRNWLAVR